MSKDTVNTADDQSPLEKAKELHDVILKHEASKQMAEKQDSTAADPDPASKGDATSREILTVLQGLTAAVAALAPAKAAEPAAAEPLPVADDQRCTAADLRAADSALATAQANADHVFSAFSKRAPAPLAGESLLAYRRRLLRDLKPQSKTFANFDIHKVDGPEFDVIEQQIFADALAASCNPVVPEGQLLEVKREINGRMVTEFYGQPKTWMSRFAHKGQRGRLVINTSSGK